MFPMRCKTQQILNFVGLFGPWTWSANLFAFLFMRPIVARLLDGSTSFLMRGGDSTNLFEARTCTDGDTQTVVADQRERSLAAWAVYKCSE